MDVPAEYRARMNEMERELREVREQLSALYSQRDPLIIPQGASEILIGITDAELTVDSTATVSRYEGSTGTETDTGIDDEVKNRMATVPSGRWVHYTQIDGVYYVIAARCTANATTTTSSSSTTSTTTTTAEPTTTTTTTTTTTSSTTTTTTSSTTTAAPTSWYCVVLDESGDCMSGNNGCVENSGGYVTCGGPYGTQQSCIDSNCGAGNTSTTTTAAPTSSTTTTTTTTSSSTTTSSTTTTTTSGPAYYCWDCFGIPNCGQDLMSACGGSGSGPTSGPYNTSNCDGMCV